jgi:hypothetical protein
MVKLICDISTSGRDRNMNMSILMFGFMGIQAGYFFQGEMRNGRNGNSACGEASEFAPQTPDTSSSTQFWYSFSLTLNQHMVHLVIPIFYYYNFSQRDLFDEMCLATIVGLVFVCGLAVVDARGGPSLTSVCDKGGWIMYNDVSKSNQ